MDCGARLVLGLLTGGSRAFVALVKLHPITTLTAFATVADVTLTDMQVAAVLPADERAPEILSVRWG